jgi:hypothetical protein
MAFFCEKHLLCLPKLLKTVKKALGKARKSGAEGVGLKLLKESGAIFLVHIRFVFILSS